jgi:hypothetical protein
MNRNLVGRSSVKDCSFRPDPFLIMTATGDLFLIGWF